MLSLALGQPFRRANEARMAAPDRAACSGGMRRRLWPRGVRLRRGSTTARRQNSRRARTTARGCASPLALSVL
jgi:hypothetical protein